MDKEQFDAWFLKFNKKFNGVKPPKKWFDTVVERHKKLRDMIGGTTKHFEAKMDDFQRPAKYNDVEPEIAELNAMIPQYFWQNELKPSDLTFPMIRRGPQEGMKWGRHIEHWRKKNAPGVDKNDISKILGRLGEKWAKCKTEKQKLHVMMTFEPAAFVLLGHYASDISLISGEPSCWCQGKCNQMDKYSLSVYNNSYVLLVTRKPFDESFTNLDVESRVWGVPDEDLNIFHMSNFYFKAQVKGKADEAVPMGNIHNAWKAFYEDLLGGPVDQTEKVFKFSPIFQNKQGSVSFHRKGSVCVPMKVVFEYKEMANPEICRYCRQEAEDMQNIDEKWVCPRCLYQVPTCAITGERTFNTVVAFHPDTKAVVYIKNELTQGRNARFTMCGLSGYFAVKEMMAKTTAYAGHYTAAIPALEQRNYEKCEDCGLWEVLKDPYDPKKHKKCYNCRIEEAKKAAKAKLSENPNGHTSSSASTTYVKLKGFARRDEYGRFVPNYYGYNDD